MTPPSSPSLLGQNATNRRQLLRQGALLTVAGALPAVGEANRTIASSPEKVGSIYRSIGVQPVINARGTFTIISGSQTLPEVKRAMEEASHSYVQMDELMAGVSKRLAEITGAPWAIIT